MRSKEERKRRAIELQEKYNLTAQQAADLTGVNKHRWKKWLYAHHWQEPSENALIMLENALGES